MRRIYTIAVTAATSLRRQFRTMSNHHARGAGAVVRFRKPTYMDALASAGSSGRFFGTPAVDTFDGRPFRSRVSALLLNERELP